MSSMEYVLSWTDSNRIVASAINDLRHAEDFTDVTLRCEGGRIRAHKVLLAAHSTYFRAVFKENPAQHPVIIFKNVQFSDLMAIVEFVYQGETKIGSDQLHSFLSTAKMFSILGLTDGWNNSEQKPQQTDAHESIAQQLPQSQGQRTATTTRNSQSSNAPSSTTVHESLQTQIPTTSTTPTVRKMAHVWQAKRQVNLYVAPETQQVHKPQEHVERLQQKTQVERHQELIAMQVDIVIDPATTGTQQQQADETDLATRTESAQHDLIESEELIILDDATNNGSKNNNSLMQDPRENIGTTHAGKLSKQSDLGRKCPACLRSFCSPYALARHQKTKHTYAKASIVCALCKTNFKSKWSLSTHMSKYHRGIIAKSVLARDGTASPVAATDHEPQKRTHFKIGATYQTS